ncbi:MAG TPA: NADH-quinone oxidoreductase subunit NuoE [Phycisphaerales bacterium]|nr:NADH-quinone oxidoreductase subunit NuoE [Phycisphaerales bacterium]
MAWITKNSAGAKVEQRSEPYLTQAMKDTLTRVYLPRYEKKQGALMPALHLVQAEHGWLPAQAMIEIADFLGLKPADVIDTASFYEEYELAPKGEHVIWVCRSIACEVCDHKKIVDTCRAKLRIEVGETTDDGKFTLREVECLGSCGTAPVALIGHELHENLTPERMERAIDEASRGGHHH